MRVNAHQLVSMRSGLLDHTTQDIGYMYQQFWLNPALLGQAQLSAWWHWACAELAGLRASCTRWQVSCTELVIRVFWSPTI